MKQGYEIENGEKIKLLRYKEDGCKLIHKPQLVEYTMCESRKNYHDEEYNEEYDDDYYICMKFTNDELDSQFGVDIGDGNTIQYGHVASDNKRYFIMFVDNESDLWYKKYHNGVFDLIYSINNIISDFGDVEKLKMHKRRVRLYMRMIKKLREC